MTAPLTATMIKQPTTKWRMRHAELTNVSLLDADALIENIFVYGPEDCPQCKTTLDFFESKNMPAKKITVQAGDAEHNYITKDLGYMQAPVVVALISDKIDNSEPNTEGSMEIIAYHWGGLNRFLLRGLSRTNCVDTPVVYVPDYPRD